MDTGDIHLIWSEIEKLQFKVKTILEDNYKLQKRIKKLEEEE